MGSSVELMPSDFIESLMIMLPFECLMNLCLIFGQTSACLPSVAAT